MSVLITAVGSVWWPMRPSGLATDDGHAPARIGKPGVVVPGCDDVVMSLTASADAVVVSPKERLEVLFEELAELTGQRNAIDGRIVEIVAEIDREAVWGGTEARSVPALVAWKTGCSPANAQTIAAVAGRLSEFPRCAQGMREGRLSLDQIGVIAARAGEGSPPSSATLPSRRMSRSYCSCELQEIVLARSQQKVARSQAQSHRGLYVGAA